MAQRPLPNYNPAGGTYDYNPAPQGGAGPFGGTPGVVGLPNPYKDLGNVIPNLGGINSAASQDIQSELNGEVSPNTIAAMRGAADRFGLKMPDISRADPIHSLGINPEQLQHQGFGDYESMLDTVSKTQTVSPEEQAMIAQFNAMNRAAPDGALQTAAGAIGLIGALAHI